MIVFLTTGPGRHTLDEYLGTAGWSARGLVTAWTYERLFRARWPLPCAVYVFTDIERLDAAATARAAEVWESLQGRPDRWLTVNRPGATLKRLALLERLHAAGINDFRAWPALGPMPDDIRWPVFLRIADDHEGPRSAPIADMDGLRRALAETGPEWPRWIVTEHAAERRPDGHFAKYGAFIVGEVILPRHVLFSDDWVVKVSDVGSDTLRAEEAAFMTSDAHATLREVFRIADVGYGRVDYALTEDGRVRVWEINTNPQIHSLTVARDDARRTLHEAFCRRFVAALTLLAQRVPAARARPRARDVCRWAAMRGHVHRRFRALTWIDAKLRRVLARVTR